MSKPYIYFSAEFCHGAFLTRKKSHINGFMLKSTEYTLLFVLLYGLVSIFEGSCANPVLNPAFLFVSSPFNPIENCLLINAGASPFVSVFSNFIMVALLIAVAGYYFNYIAKITKNNIRMSYVFGSSVLATYIASAASIAYFSRFPEITLKVATGTSIIGFDMCLFMTVFMLFELFYYYGSRPKNSRKRMSFSSRYPFFVQVRFGAILIFFVLMSTYLRISLVHLAGLFAFPIFAMLIITFSHKNIVAAFKPLGKYWKNRQ